MHGARLNVVSGAIVTQRIWGRTPAELTLVQHQPARRGLLIPGPNRDVQQVVVRPVMGRDHQRVEAVRRANWQWLSPWEATLPAGSSEELPDIYTYRRRMDRLTRRAEVLFMMVEVDGQIAGQISLSGVQWGALSSGALGYWLARAYAGRGIGALSVAMVIDLVIGRLGLHRIEVNVRPENARSLGLCHKLGLRDEGLRVRYMNIAGTWADHRSFAVDAEMLPTGGLVRAIWGDR